MSLINLKFTPEMEKAILDGRKCCTSRREKKGDVGDVFRVNDRFYQVVHVREVGLHPLTFVYYDAEGFQTPEDFRTFWENHTGESVDWQSNVWIHFFAYIGGSE